MFDPLLTAHWPSPPSLPLRLDSCKPTSWVRTWPPQCEPVITSLCTKQTIPRLYHSQVLITRRASDLRLLPLLSLLFKCPPVCNKKRGKTSKVAENLQTNQCWVARVSGLKPASLSSPGSFFFSNHPVPSTWRGDGAKSRGRWRLSCHEMKGAAIPSKWRMIRDLRSKHGRVFLAAAAESDVRSLSSFPLLQELIEVDSDVVFELASYILQVSKVIGLFLVCSVSSCSLLTNAANYRLVHKSWVEWPYLSIRDELVSAIFDWELQFHSEKRVRNKFFDPFRMLKAATVTHCYMKEQWKHPKLLSSNFNLTSDRSHLSFLFNKMWFKSEVFSVYYDLCNIHK